MYQSLAEFDTDAIATISSSLPLTGPIPEEVIDANKLLKEQIQAWFECAQKGLGMCQTLSTFFTIKVSPQVWKR